MAPLIIELEFEKYTLDPHIIIGENIQLQMRKKRPTVCERCLQFGHQQKYCRSDRELCTNCAEQLLEGRMHDCKKKHTRQDIRKYVKNIKWKQQSRAKLD